MNTLRDYIDTLSYQDLIALVNDYERFEQDGSIGECRLRETAGNFLLPGSSIVSLMERVAFEAYRAIAIHHTDIYHMEYDRGVEEDQLAQAHLEQSVYYKDLIFDILEGKKTLDEVRLIFQCNYEERGYPQ